MWRFKLALSTMPYSYKCMDWDEILDVLERSKYFMRDTPGRIRLSNLIFILKHSYLFTEDELYARVTGFLEWVFRDDIYKDILDFTTKELCP